MRAEIIAVGTELLLGQIANTNAQFLSNRLALDGISVFYHQVVGDNLIRIKESLSLADRSDLILLTGGLGPTEDDLTREALADFLGLPLKPSDAWLKHLEEYFCENERKMPPNNLKQALLIEGATLLHNSRGTAPGQYIFANGRHYVLLPGPPTELQPLFMEQVLPLVRQSITQTSTIRSRVLRLFGIGESTLETQIADIILRQGNPTVAPYASEGEVTLRITASAQTEEEAYQLIVPVEDSLRSRIGQFVYGIDDETLPIVVGKHLKQRNQTLSLAESCTGGMLSSMLTDIPGSSSYLIQGWVTYSNESKTSELDVSPHILMTHGAVSAECARAMADGARKHSGADWAVAITGIAGPDGGTAEKPVGLVFISVARANETIVEQHYFRGDRMQIRIRASKYALYALLSQILLQNER